MTNMKWQDFLAQAQLIVAAEKALWPGCEHLVAFGRGGGSTSYKRTGTGVHTRNYSVPQNISDLIDSNVANSATDPGLASLQSQTFSRIMQETPEDQPGYGPLSQIAGQDPQNYTGFSTLASVARRNPYDSTYEADTADRFKQNASDALAQVQSGPDAVRGGAARSGIAQGVMSERLASGRADEVRKAQLTDLLSVTDAAKSAAGIEATRGKTIADAALGLTALGGGTDSRALEAGKALDTNKMYNMNLLQLASALQGTVNDTQTDNFRGKGDQSNWQAGVSCCFIFLQALNGRLPWYIEIARVQFWTRHRREGYTWMASWLVPAMRRWAAVQWLVNAVIVKPFLAYGAWLYGDASAKRRSAMLAPYCKMWFNIWSWIGRRVWHTS